ncbi:MAG TPA: site-specific integrase [Pseudomonas sp.]|uniref:tyrosine-type recombinase/integrase n=1 Tax=Pseudomonas sp. TaxID=306 RepID=UPI002ED9C9AC
MSTAAVNLSDAEIRRQAADPSVHTLRDPRHPGLYFRFNEGRARGSWYLVVKRSWRRIAGYPDLKANAVLAVLPELRQRMVLTPNASAAIEAWSTVGDLLDWFGERMSRARSLSEKRKAAGKSAIACHLKPRLADLPIRDVSAQTLDKLLMWPAQETLSLSYVQQLYRLLAVAFRQARKLDLIPVNPMADLKFVDFTTARIMPKPARLRGVQLPEVVTLLAERFDSSPGEAMLALMMLCHGTRIGETRMARWADIALPEREWFIPAEHTKTRTEHRLPLTDQVCTLLRRYREQQLAQGYEGAYLFPSRRGKQLSENQASAVFTRLGRGEWTSHDLRKVARTAWTDLGIDGHIGEMLLNHSLGKIASTYINTQATEQRRLALMKWHDWLDGRGFKAIHGQTGVRYEDSQTPVQATNDDACKAIPQFVNGEV